MTNKDNLMIQNMTLLSQQLANIKGEEIYQITSCLHTEERELIGILKGIQQLPDISKEVKSQCEKLIPFFSEVGKARWPRTELTDLGLRVGNRFRGRVSDKDEEDKPLVVDDDSDTS